MNIHPLFVHFPIALLAIYSIVEIVGAFSTRLRQQTWFMPVTTFLLFFGVLASLGSIGTGGMAEDLIRDVNPRIFIVEVHEPFAFATTLVYALLAASYLVRIFDQRGWWSRIIGTNSFLIRIWNIKKYFAHLVLDTWVLPLLALLGLVFLTITGGLGAALVYGPDIDPFVSFVYHLFWAQ